MKLPSWSLAAGHRLPVLLATLALVLILAPALPVAASDLLPDFIETPFSSTTFEAATTMRFAPDGRLFVLEQGGTVWIVKPDGTVPPNPFLTVATDDFFERGLLGIAFDPDFATNQYVYLYYTVPETTRFNRVSRFTADGDVAVPGSEFPLMDLDPLNAGNHNGGAINFGSDGKLYIAIGDNAESANSQSLATRHGKLLRINPDGSIPTDNPFYDTTTGDNRAIWALGLRNPFNFTVQPGTGVIFTNDVGQSTWEEVNQGAAGANYGWPTTEGDFDPGDFPDFTPPLYAYSHDDGCSITGAAFYNPATATFPAEYVGDYFFADYCGDWIRRYDVATDTATDFATDLTGTSPVEIVVSDAGDLYYLSHNSGVFRIQYQPATGGELLVNGGMETDANTDKVPDTWTLTNVTKAKQICNKEGNTVAHSGDCAFQSKSNGSAGKLQQKIAGSGYGADDQVTLTAWVWGKNAAAGASLQVVVRYNDATKAKGKLDLPAGTYAYQELSTLVDLTGTVQNFRVQLKNPTVGGKFRVDEVSLLAAVPAAVPVARAAAPLPLIDLPTP